MDIDGLYHQAQECLDKGDFKAAISLGEQLVRYRYSGGYEVLARSFLAQGNPGQALTALERGLQDTPQVWRLWMEKAGIHGLRQEYEKAVQAFAQARNCPEAEVDAIDFNEARMAHQWDRPRRAAKLLEGIIERTEDKDAKLVALTELCRILALRGRMGEMMAILGQEGLPPSEVGDILNILSDTMMGAGHIFEGTHLAEQARMAKKAAAEQADSSD